MHHARAEDLDPPRALAHRAPNAAADPALHVHLGRGLREGEVARPEACFRGAEEALRKARERRLEIDEGDAFVHTESLDLLKCWRVRGIEEVAAKDEAGNQYANWRRIRLER